MEAGANVKAVGEKLTTPLHFTARSCSPHQASLQADRVRADCRARPTAPQALNGPGRTEGSVEFAELLLEKGADPSAKNQASVRGEAQLARRACQFVGLELREPEQRWWR